MDPYTWVYIIILVISLVYAYASRPKPTTPEAQKSQAPQVADGTRILKAYGTNWVDDSMVLAWKQDGTDPIMSKGGKK